MRDIGKGMCGTDKTILPHFLFPNPALAPVMVVFVVVVVF